MQHMYRTRRRHFPADFEVQTSMKYVPEHQEEICRNRSTLGEQWFRHKFTEHLCAVSAVPSSQSEEHRQ